MRPQTESRPSRPLVSVVVIGRNEGERLRRCLSSIGALQPRDFDLETLYVDSHSSDGSPQCASELGARVLELCAERPSAALGRNAGWRAARGEFVLFLDGDTELHPDFLPHALASMRDPQVAVVWGHRREARPEQSLYVRALDLDWIYPPGPSEFCGGDALMRRSLLAEVGGFDATLIAGEEPELCRRLRARGYRIEHIDQAMTRHDLAITSFRAYWKRAFRAGHAYAEVAARFAGSSDPLWQRDTRRNWLHGSALLALLPSLALASLWPWLLIPLLTAGALLLQRSMHRCAWKTPDRRTRLLYAVHSHFQKLPILAGQLSYWLNQQRARHSRLIEYK